jgi:hypothetical protein
MAHVALVMNAPVQDDLEALPEKEFPVFCPQCDYLLRGLPDDRCPECGKSFERSRLLLQQYIDEDGKRSCRKLNRTAKVCFIAGIVLVACAILFGLGITLVNPSELTAYCAASLMWIGGALQLLGMCLWIRMQTLNRRRRQQVFQTLMGPDNTINS